MGELEASLEVQPDENLKGQRKITTQILEMITPGMKKGRRWWEDKVMGRRNSRRKTKEKPAQ